MMAQESHLDFMSESDEEHFDESLTSKLLRWLSASVVIGRISWKLDSLNLATSEKPSPDTLYSLLEHVKNTRDDSGLHQFGCEELLAANIFYLLQHLKSSFTVFPVVISSLCLLLFDALISAGILKCLKFFKTFIVIILSSWSLCGSEPFFCSTSEIHLYN